MVFQEFNLLPWRHAHANVSLGLEIQGHARADIASRASAALELVNLPGVHSYLPHQLSGGMKQRVGLARALATGADVLLMDEPFGSLDPQIRELMQVELMSLLERDRRTVAFVTHSVDEAILMSDRIVLFTARPARVKEVLAIDLPRPRGVMADDLRLGQRFTEYRRAIWRSLKPEVVAETAPAPRFALGETGATQ
jgi:NitT/TauT family transport system ATP-binding protein